MVPEPHIAVVPTPLIVTLPPGDVTTVTVPIPTPVGMALVNRTQEVTQRNAW